MENQNPSFCNSCYQPFTLEDVFCNGCGYPIQGSQHEQDQHIALRNVKEIDLQESNKKLTSARNSLFWIAGMIGVWGLIYYAANQDNEDAFANLITNVILVGAFLAFGVWSKTKPAGALISGLSLFLIVQVLNLIVSPLSIFSGILFKIIIIGYLIKGIKAVLEIDKLKKELNFE